MSIRESRITADTLNLAKRQSQAVFGMLSDIPERKVYFWKAEGREHYVITTHRKAELMPGFDQVFDMFGREVTSC